jgi:proline iminopeptidase
VKGLYPKVEPYEHGMLRVGADTSVYWETCGNPVGKPALVLHGGPGSGCTPWHRRLFDPAAYRVVLFDQRNCGRSLPSASRPDTDLSSNCTPNLLADIELLRRRLEIDRWTLLGGSWGSTLALVYAEAYPERVSEVVLWGVTTGRREEFDWWFRGGAALLFPEQWQRLRDALPAGDRDRDIASTYYRLLHDADPGVRAAAALSWCRWESITALSASNDELSPRFLDPDFRMAYARIVTHYVVHNAWLEDCAVLRDAPRLSGIPGVMVSGRFDVQAPLRWAWELKQAWPSARHVIVDKAGHDGSAAPVTAELVAAIDEFATRRIN